MELHCRINISKLTFYDNLWIPIYEITCLCKEVHIRKKGKQDKDISEVWLSYNLNMSFLCTFIQI